MAVAVVFGGWFHHPFDGPNIRERLLRPLGGAVHLALTYNDRDNCTTVSSCGLEERYHDLAPSQIDLRRQSSDAELLQLLKGLPH
eukprot:5303434-Prymnesium_polylepis.1